MSDKKIKICHVTYDMRIGGTEQVILNLILGTKDQFNHQVLCIESPLGPFAKKLIDEEINIQSLTRKPGFDIQLLQQIRQYIMNEEIDILHCHQYTPWSYGVLACIGLKTKVIFTEHGRFYPDSISFKRKIINPLLSLVTAKITAISHATKEALITYENLSKEKIEVIYNGIEKLKFHNTETEKLDSLKEKLDLNSNDFILGTIARFDPIKNHEMMIRSIAELNSEGLSCTLILVGDGENKQQLESLIDQLNIREKVVMTGYQPNPKYYFKLFDVFLLTSFSEGTSMTLLEAMSLGLPSIVTDVGGNPEIITHNKNGIVIPSNNTDSLKKAIRSLYDNTRIKCQLSSNAMDDFNKFFIANKMNQRYSNIYKDIVNG
ncbi:glycosyltransferase [Opacimonas viscosa]|uniref:Glycosyltransferase n=1 Tax=Opacimonas viscosa TaxID=2961944 RepID=A0AA42BL69_9ALTE|nr:glycosyltransferase [Opacimonas viscosa]MCP3428500.1 glycosyltransferase [Opacimonas viscosa]